MIEPLSSPSPKVLGFKLSGKLHDEDYKQFVPLVDDAIAKSGGHGRGNGAIAVHRGRARRGAMLRVRHRVGHHYLKLLLVIGKRHPDGLAWAMPQVRFNRARAGLTDGEAYFIEQ